MEHCNVPSSTPASLPQSHEHNVLSHHALCSFAVTWMNRPTVAAGCPPGLEYLASIDQLVVKQQIELMECKPTALFVQMKVELIEMPYISCQVITYSDSHVWWESSASYYILFYCSIWCNVVHINEVDSFVSLAYFVAMASEMGLMAPPPDILLLWFCSDHFLGMFQ